MTASSWLADGDRGHQARSAPHEANIDARGRTRSRGQRSGDAVSLHQAAGPHEAKLELYRSRRTEGTDAQARSVGALAHEGRSDDRAWLRSGYAGGLGQGLSRSAQQIVMKRQRDMPAAAAS